MYEKSIPYTDYSPGKKECGFPGGRCCLWRVLREIRFNYKKIENKLDMILQHILNTDMKNKHLFTWMKHG